MEFLCHLVNHIDQHQFANTLGTSKYLRLLFDTICAQKLITTKEAEVILYGNSNNSQAFKQVKLRLRKKLLEYIAQNGVVYKNIDKYALTYIRCMNHVHASKSMILTSARDVSVVVSEHAIRATIKNEFTELTMLLSKDLLYYYSTINFDARKMAKYQDILKTARVSYAREIEAHLYYCELRSEFQKSRGVLSNGILTKAVEYSEILKPYLVNPHKSYSMIVDSYNVLAMRHEIERNYKRLLEICDEAQVELSRYRFHRPVGFYTFDLYKIQSLINLGMHQEASKITSKYFSKMTPGLYNWVVLKYYACISKLQTKAYVDAYVVLREVVDMKSHARLSATIQEVWKVLEAHFEYLVLVGRVEAKEEGQFRLSKFLNEIPLYTKDKRGLNIAILIIQVLFLLQKRKYSQIIDRVDALKLYDYRYLRKDDTFRSHCFIRMLLQMPKADFNRIRTERYAEPYLRKLKSVPMTISQQNIEVEVIPYEDLWEMTLELLD